MTLDRATWIRRLRRENAEQEDALSSVYDARWGEIEDTHRAFVERFLASLPPDGRVLDAACGTGKYFGIVLDSGRSVLGVDHSAGHLAGPGRSSRTCRRRCASSRSSPSRASSTA